MKNVSLHCLNTQSPEATIKTILSAKTYAKQVIVGDVTSSDKLKSFCSSNDLKYVKMSVNDSLSQCHNDLMDMSEMKWHMHLYPGETVNNPVKITETTHGSPAVYRLPCIQAGWLNKETRLYHRDLGCRFSNPVFESIDYKTPRFLEAYVAGAEGGLPAHNKRLLETWSVKQPLSIEQKYYGTLTCLMEGKQTAFIDAARNYLFLDTKQSVSNIMMRYYLACALANKPQTRQEAARQLVTCLAASVLMAEFWCLLGDLCQADGSYERAKAMYRNAIVLGGQRHKDDAWPMHIAKYNDHPEAMTAACNESARNAVTFKVKVV